LVKKELKFSEMDLHSDLTKKIDGELEENGDMVKEADLYHKTLFTVVPKSHDHSLGIFPDDQQLSHSSVLLWDTVKGIPPAAIDVDYKVLKITINFSIIRDSLKTIGGGVYSLRHIPNTLPIEEVDSISYKGE